MKKVSMFIILFLLTSHLFAQNSRYSSILELNISTGKAIHTADLNRDGFVDIIAANNNTEQIHIFLNDGSGGFNADADLTYDAPISTIGISTADLNEDERTDIVLSGRMDSTIYIYFGQADNTFGSRLDINTHQDHVYDVITGDIDNDMYTDIVAVTQSGYFLLVYKGNGDGSFQTAASYGTYGTSYEICMADFNSDGFLDIAQSNGGGSNWIRYLNDGSGGYSDRSNIYAINPPSRLDVADMDKDGITDLVWGSANYPTDNLAIQLNDGSSFTETSRISPGAYLKGIRIADLDNDGNLDVASIDNNGTYISVTDGSGIFTGTDTIAEFPSTSVEAIDVADFENNGFLDLAVCQQTVITLIFNVGDPSAISDEAYQLSDYTLHQNYPNPFNPTTAISYQLSAVSDVELMVYNTLGQRVQTLVNKRQEAGTYSLVFNGGGLPSGVYFYSLNTDTYTHTRKMILIK